MHLHTEPLQPAEADSCLAMAARLFAKKSTLHRASSVREDVYRCALRSGFMHMVKQDLSVAAYQGDQIVGAVIACDLLDQGPSANAPELQAMQALMHQMEDRYLALRNPTKCASVLVDMAFVTPEATGGGIYTALRYAAQERAAKRGFQHVVGLLSSAATQRVVVGKMGHEVLFRERFDTFMFNGTMPLAAITDPEEILLTEGSLT